MHEKATFLVHKNLKGKQQQHCFDHNTGKINIKTQCSNVLKNNNNNNQVRAVFINCSKWCELEKLNPAAAPCQGILSKPELQHQGQRPPVTLQGGFIQKITDMGGAD